MSASVPEGAARQLRRVAIVVPDATPAEATGRAQALHDLRLALEARGIAVAVHPAGTIRTLRALRRRPRPDAVLCWGLECGFAGALADAVLNLPVVVRFDSGTGAGGATRRPGIGERELLRRARRVRVAGEEGRHELLKRGRLVDELFADRLAPRIDLEPRGVGTSGSERLVAEFEEAIAPAPRVWLVSPAPWTRGGVAAVARQVLVSPLARRYRLAAVPTYVAGSAWVRLGWALRGLFTVCAGLVFRRPALVHLKVASRGSFARKYLVHALCRARGVPVIVHVHGGGFDEFVRTSPNWVRALAAEMLERSPRVLSLSERWAGTLRRLFPRARVEALTNPVDAGAFDDLAEARRRRKPAAPPRPPVALFLGDLVARKGVGDLLEAWSSVIAAIPEARLVIAGGGDRPSVRARSDALGLGETVELPGWVDGPAKREQLARADLFVLPSYAEGVPIALLEAMASGLPSVVTPVGGVLDAVSDRVEARFVEPGDPGALARALLELLGDPELADRLGRAARARARELDISVYARRLAEHYAFALGGPDPTVLATAAEPPERAAVRVGGRP